MENEISILTKLSLFHRPPTSVGRGGLFGHVVAPEFATYFFGDESYMDRLLTKSWKLQQLNLSMFFYLRPYFPFPLHWSVAYVCPICRDTHLWFIIITIYKGFLMFQFSVSFTNCFRFSLLFSNKRYKCFSSYQKSDKKNIWTKLHYTHLNSDYSVK